MIPVHVGVGRSTRSVMGGEGGRGALEESTPAVLQRSLQVAYLCAAPPWPLRSGYQIRCFQVARQLLDAGHRLRVYSLWPGGKRGEEGAVAEEVAGRLGVPTTDVIVRATGGTTPWAVGRAVVSSLPIHSVAFRSRRFRRAIRRCTTQDVDLVYCHLMHMLQYRNLFPATAKVFLDQHNLDSDHWRQLGLGGRNRWIRLIAQVNLPRVLAHERQLYPHLDCCVCCAAEDLDLTRGITTEPLLLLAPNGVDIGAGPPAMPSLGSDPLILFLGGRDRKNAVAAERALRAVFPMVRRSVPTARLRVAGRVCERLDERLLRGAGVECFGEFDAPAAPFEGVWLVLAPFSYGGGSKLKVLEAFAMGRPVVGTPNAFRGIEVPPELRRYCSDTDAGLAELTVSLLEDRRRIGALGATLAQVSRDYDWRLTLSGIPHAVSSIVNPAHTTVGRE